MITEIMQALKASGLSGSRVYESSAPHATALPYAQVYLLGGNDIAGDGRGLNVMSAIVVVDCFVKQGIDYYVTTVNQQIITRLAQYVRLRYARTLVEDDGVIHIVMEYEVL